MFEADRDCSNSNKSSSNSGFHTCGKANGIGLLFEELKRPEREVRLGAEKKTIIDWLALSIWFYLLFVRRVIMELQNKQLVKNVLRRSIVSLYIT